MRVSKERFMAGIVNYVEKELMPHLSTTGKIVVGTAIGVSSGKLEGIIDGLVSNPMIKAVDLVDDAGMIDYDLLLDQLRNNMEKYGCIEINIPFMGGIRFKAEDAERLKSYM